MVRAAPDRDQIRKVRVSVATAVVVGLLVFFAWFWLNQVPNSRPVPRLISDVDVNWVCDKDDHHGFRAGGGYDPIPCPSCNGKCYMSFDFVCPVHRRSFLAMVKMEASNRDGNLNERIKAYRIPSGEDRWIEGNCVRCPESGCDECAERPRPKWKIHKANTTNP